MTATGLISTEGRYAQGVRARTGVYGDPGGAGGAITDWEGGALSLPSGSRILAAGAPPAHAQALDPLAPD